MFLLYIILFLAACTDFKSYRIPNRLIVTGYLLGLIYQIIWSDQNKFYLYPLYAFFILLLTIPLFRFGVIGGGDCKLFSVCAMFTGIVRTISIFIYAFFFSGAICAVLVLFQRLFPGKKQIHTIHFSIYILIGALIEGVTKGRLWNVESLFLTGRVGL